MDPINGINQIVHILRQKLGDRKTGGVDSKSTPTGAAQSGRSAKTSPEEIQKKIGARIRALSEEETTGTQAAQIFVESIITWEFGDTILQDPGFAELSKEIVNGIAENKSSWARMQTLLAELKRA